MPDIMEGSILIMSKAGIGTAMFNMGKITCVFDLTQIKFRETTNRAKPINLFYVYKVNLI